MLRRTNPALFFSRRGNSATAAGAFFSRRRTLLGAGCGFALTAVGAASSSSLIALCDSSPAASAPALVESDGTPDLHDARNSPCELEAGRAEKYEAADFAHVRWSWLQALRFFFVVGSHLAWHVAKNTALRVLCWLHIASPPEPKRYKKVAIIGGGIAGCVAAWCMRDTHEVTLFEQRAALGGNAKVVTYPLESEDGQVSTTAQVGTGVLAAPDPYFRHYFSLLKLIGHPHETVAPRFMVSDDGKTATYRQGAYNERWDKDQQAWDSFIASVRTVNNALTGSNEENKSIYAISLLNPYNLLSARRVARWHGVSDDFWDTVVVPLYSSSFLSTRLDDIPAVMMPIVDDIITVGKEGGVKELETWSWSSQHVFKELAKQIGWNRVRLNANINSVAPRAGGGVDIELGGPVGVEPTVEHFDAVIFACSAPSVDALTYNNSSAQGRTTLFNELISNVEYCDHTDFNFMDCVAHTNEKLALPEGLRDEVLRDRYANYVRVDKTNRGKLEVENTFVLGSWIPDALRAEKEVGRRAKFYISYNMPQHRETLLDENKEVFARLTNRWAHPALSTLNQLIAASLRMVQGDHDIFYTGQFACLGTGHDISTTYSVVLATYLGAPYPFEQIKSDKHLRRDYELVQSYMGLY